MSYAGHAINVFLGETSDSWERPIPKDKTIRVEIFQNPQTGEIEYFRYNMPFLMEVTIHDAEDQNGKIYLQHKTN